MRDTLTDANFPRTADQRVYHLGLRPGEVANRIITVGSPSRAEIIASRLDETPKPFRLSSERGFLTITGRYREVPVSIVSIGMGSPNMDFFVREVRECLAGEMAVIRLGSCGGLTTMPVGSVVVPTACVAVSRNLDFDFHDPSASGEPAYRISKPVSADVLLEEKLREALVATRPKDSETPIITGSVNASADSFYSSQGRQTSFPDHNAHLIDDLLSAVKDLATLEMETHHLYHLAACWGKRSRDIKANPAPLTTGPVVPIASRPPPSSTPITLAGSDTTIRAAAVQMVFASRLSQDFITPKHVEQLEHWTGKGALEALFNLEIPLEQLHPEAGSVWEARPSGQ